jgi:hypothetical protein
VRGRISDLLRHFHHVCLQAFSQICLVHRYHHELPSVSAARPTISPSNSTQKTIGNYAYSQSFSLPSVQTPDSESQTGPNITKNMVERFESLSTSSPRQPHPLPISRKSPDKQPLSFDPKAHDKPTPPHLLQYPVTRKLLVNPSEDLEAERPPLPQRHEWHVQPKLRNPASEPITRESATTGL